MPLRQRTRSRVTGTVTSATTGKMTLRRNGVVFLDESQPPPTFAGNRIPDRENSEYMLDYVGSRGGGSVKRCDCLHIKRTFVPTGTVLSPTWNEPNEVIHTPYSASAAVAVKDNRPGGNLPALDQNWISDSLRGFGTQFKTAVDLPAFVGELDDIPKLLPDLMMRLRSAARDLGSPKRPIRNARELRRFVRRKGRGRTDFGDAWLTDNFGIAPLLSDLQALFNIFQIVDKRLNWLRNTNKRWVTVRRRTSVEVPELHEPWYPGMSVPVFLGGSDILNLSIGQTVDWHWASTSVRCIVGASVYRETSYLNDELAIISGALSALGFGRPWASLWELIPFSWTVDYLTNVSAVLKTVEQQPLPGTVYITNGWVSQQVTHKYDAEATVRLQGWWGGGTPSTGLIGHGQISVYNRTAGIPAEGYGTLLHWENGPLSFNQYTNILSVLK